MGLNFLLVCILNCFNELRCISKVNNFLPLSASVIMLCLNKFDHLFTNQTYFDILQLKPRSAKFLIVKIVAWLFFVLVNKFALSLSHVNWFQHLYSCNIIDSHAYNEWGLNETEKFLILPIHIRHKIYIPSVM